MNEKYLKEDIVTNWSVTGNDIIINYDPRFEKEIIKHLDFIINKYNGKYRISTGIAFLDSYAVIKYALNNLLPSGWIN